MPSGLLDAAITFGIIIAISLWLNSFIFKMLTHLSVPNVYLRATASATASTVSGLVIGMTIVSVL